MLEILQQLCNCVKEEASWLRSIFYASDKRDDRALMHPKAEND